MIGKLFGKDSFADMKDYLRTRQVSYMTTHKSALTVWINKLDEDYLGSGLYESYNYLYDESKKRILAKEFVAACPVDVYIYDQSDQLVASVIEGRIYCNGDVTVGLVVDTKIVRFYKGADYRIEYVGNDWGVMDVTISEFNKDEEKVRVVNYYNLNLETETTYREFAHWEISNNENIIKDPTSKSTMLLCLMTIL